MESRPGQAIGMNIVAKTDQGQLVGFHERIRNVSARASQTAAMLSTLNERLHGPTPEACGDASKEPQSSGVLSQIDRALSELSDAMEFLERQAKSLACIA